MRARFVIGSVVVLLAWLPLPSNGSPLTLTAPASGTADCVREHVDAVGMACRRADGLLEVRLADGRVLTTHGPDPRPSHQPGDELLSYPERAPVCAAANDYAQQVIYARPANGPDRLATATPQIRSIFKHMNGALNAESAHSGGPTADYKVRCAAGEISVGSFVVGNSSNDFEQIVNAAINAGFTGSKSDYSIFYDASHPAYCGVAHFFYDDRPGATNANNNGGGYAVTYQGCWTGRTPMHENAHNQGAVQLLAPFSDLNAHCLEGEDVMCYTSDFVPLCRDRMHFDCGHDTYFDSAPEPGEWLSSHWNIGSRVNRFIAFGP